MSSGYTTVDSVDGRQFRVVVPSGFDASQYSYAALVKAKRKIILYIYRFEVYFHPGGGDWNSGIDDGLAQDAASRGLVTL